MTIGNEHILRVAKTPKGYKVTHRDGTGLAENVYTIRRRRYFYPDDHSDAEKAANEYAERVAEDLDTARVVKLGERV